MVGKPIFFLGLTSSRSPRPLFKTSRFQQISKFGIRSQQARRLRRESIALKYFVLTRQKSLGKWPLVILPFETGPGREGHGVRFAIEQHVTSHFSLSLLPSFYSSESPEPPELFVITGKLWV